MFNSINTILQNYKIFNYTCLCELSIEYKCLLAWFLQLERNEKKKVFWISLLQCIV